MDCSSTTQVDGGSGPSEDVEVVEQACPVATQNTQDGLEALTVRALADECSAALTELLPPTPTLLESLCSQALRLPNPRPYARRAVSLKLPDIASGSCPTTVVRQQLRARAAAEYKPHAPRASRGDFLPVLLGRQRSDVKVPETNFPAEELTISRLWVQMRRANAKPMRRKFDRKANKAARKRRKKTSRNRKREAKAC